MRERILEALYKKIDENPNNTRLQKQIILLNKSNISTIHSFCLDVIKNNFYEIGISPNFRIGDTSEIEIIKQESLEEIFEELYETENEEFINLVNIYGGYKNDDDLKKLIMQIYNYSGSTPFPNEWIHENVEKFNMQNKLEEDFSNTEWGKILINNFQEEVSNEIRKLNILKNELKEDEKLDKYYITICEDIDILETLLKSDNTFDEIYKNLQKISFKTLPPIRNLESELKDKTKDIRNNTKKKFTDFSKKYFMCSSKEANRDIFEMYKSLKVIENLIARFSERYQKNKSEKGIIDFTDIEHFALNILVKKDEDNNYSPTEVAKKYKEKFNEIAIDEYQDSNLVQEYILKTISNGNNIFMVGDVKQSIYKFRQARPELFLEKYNSYKNVEKDNNECLYDTKIQLFKNFRSRESVLDITNFVFENIMSSELGDIDYNKNEFLNLGMEYPVPKQEMQFAGNAELNIIDLNQEIEEETDELLENTEIEAKFVANKIKNIIDSNYCVYDKHIGYRKAAYRDFVILLRTTSNVANVYERELEKLEIPVFSDVSQSYFENEEIEVIRSLLKIIDNPNSDIPLVTVLRSPILKFTDNELLEIRLCNRSGSFYEAMCDFKVEDNERLYEKIHGFFTKLSTWQEKEEILTLDEFIWYLYQDTSYYDFVNSMPNGDLKIANLKLLFEKAKDYENASFKGLYNFITYIDRVKKTTGDMTSAKLIGENENVVRIMSIHKSKGLEFPIVILSGTGKQFNLQDLNQSILLHQDIGFGPKYINFERKIEYSTLAKEAIKIKMKNEVLSEEMRILYVALTRAKEKLIITGVEKDFAKSMEWKNVEIDKQYKKIEKGIIAKAKSYLDWIEMIIVKDNKYIDVNVFGKDISSKIEEDSELEELKINSKGETEDYKKIEEMLNWKYPFEEVTKIEGKTSVSKIVKKEKNKIVAEAKPKFLENKKMTNSEKGTLMHLVLQKLDFKESYNESRVKELINKMISNEVITSDEASYIDIEKILKFTTSSMYKRAKEAKYLYKEQPFYINIPAEENEEEKILVQGIIDLYFVERDGNIVLVDYKTDYVAETEEELIKKYNDQLELYKQAIEKSINKKVDEVYIYSIYLGREIKI